MTPPFFEIKSSNGKIIEINLNIKKKGKYAPYEKECCLQLKEYFKGKRSKFSILLKMEGTEFQKKVWEEITKIPYGKTVSYKELAKKINAPYSYRAVANACGANKIPIVIPCHRVVASNGFGGYSAGLELKKYLLELECKNKSNSK